MSVTYRNWIGGNGGTWKPEKRCADGEIVTQFYGRAGKYLDDLGIKCSDGKDLRTLRGDGAQLNIGPFGSIVGGTAWKEENLLGWSDIGARGGGIIDQFMGHGGNGGNPARLSCDIEKKEKIIGIKGKTGSYVDSMEIICGRDKSEWCYDNLDDGNFCTITNLGPELLGKMCDRQLTTKNKLPTICKNNPTVLNSTSVENYCKTHLTDPFCSCYRPIPDNYSKYIADKSAQCWNRECQDFGYKSNITPMNCGSPISICKKTISDAESQGTDKIVWSKDVNLIDCLPPNMPINPDDPLDPSHNVATPPIYTGPTITPSNTQANQTQATSMTFKLFIIFIFFVLAIILGFGIKYIAQPNPAVNSVN